MTYKYLKTLLLATLIVCSFSFLSSCKQPPPEAPMVTIPAGKFIFGTDETDKLNKAKEFGSRKPWYEDEHPRKVIDLKAYKIDKYEVTNEQYKAFVNDTDHRSPVNFVNGEVPKGREKHPVTLVDWSDADEFCRWAGKRLPTEQEWEKAARGPKGNEFPWGASFDAKKTNSGQVRDAAPVDKFETDKSHYGVYGMGGNVMEWTGDWYQPYSGNEGSKSVYYGKKYKVVRGGGGAGLGGHYLIDHYHRNGYRRFFPQDKMFGDLGIRCAADANTKTKI